MDAIELLKKDHAEVDELFRRYQIAERGDTRAELARQIVHDLSVHAAIEEQFVYPLVRLKVEKGNQAAGEAIDEHAQVKRLLADIEKADPASDRHEELMNQVIEAVRHHVEEEENDVFPKLRDATNDNGRKALGALLERAKAVVPTHPHPLVPGTATAQLLAGPWAALLDRARDLVGSRVGGSAR